MKQVFIALILAAALIQVAPAANAEEQATAPLVRIPAHPQIDVETSEGTFRLELVTKEAPHTVRHILGLIDAGFYDGLIFHRVIGGFMIQGGGYTPGFKLREDDQSVVNESGNSLSNTRGTIALARLPDPHSANSQFFINLVDNSRLDPQKGAAGGRWGYTVFGYVIDGMDVVDAIAAAETGPQGEHPTAPIIPIIIKKMSQVTYD